MSDTKIDRIYYQLPRIIVGLALCYIVAALAISWFVDFREAYVPVVSEWMERWDVPIFWLRIFREASITEQLQWTLLGLSALICIMIYALEYIRSKKHSGAWGLLAVGLIIMLLEDSMNIRHGISDMFLNHEFFQEQLGFDSFGAGNIRTITELTFYAILGGIMVISFYLIYSDANRPDRGIRYLFIGYIVYGIAAVSSATRLIGGWYSATGDWLLAQLLANTEVNWTDEEQIQLYGYHFIDMVFEESLELLGASIILAALIIFVSSQD